MAKISLNLKKLFTLPSRLIKQSKQKVLKKINTVDNDFSLAGIWRNKELRQKILFTLAMLVVFRILATIPLPGINIKIFNEVFGNNPLSNIFTVVTGGRLDNPSVVAIGLGAYINASVVMQLMQTLIPKLEELSKEGERGRRVINQYTRLLAIPLNVIQAIVIFTVLKTTAAQPQFSQLAGLLANTTTLDIVTMVVALTAGSMVLMWISELITEYGIGNGSSIIIAVGILSIMPSLVVADFKFIGSDFQLLLQNGNFNVLLNSNFILLYAVIIGVVLLVWGIVYVTEATRKITIQYANRVRSVQAGNSSFLPLKLNQAGVMPVIFASALLSFPSMIASLLISSSNEFIKGIGTAINNSFLNYSVSGNTSDVFYYELLYFVLIIVFTYFYTFVTFKPSETADNLKKSAGFIPGIRPGKETEAHITYILLRLTFVGAAFLAIVALIPTLVRLIPQGANLSIMRGIGGTSILIVVGVVIDTIRQMKSVSVSKSYDKFR